MRSRAFRTQARLTAVAELLEAPVFPEDGDGLGDCPSSGFFPPDDGYCALCRRCQMRRKLEKRLQKKRDEEDEVPAERDVEDERTIEEIMQFIGEGTSKSRRRRRKRKPKRSQSEVETTLSRDANSPQSIGSASGSASGSSAAENESYHHKSEYQDTSGSSPISPHGCCNDHHNIRQHCDSPLPEDEANSKHDDDGITPEQEAQIERELEEFRMRLACQNSHQDLPRIALTNR